MSSIAEVLSQGMARDFSAENARTTRAVDTVDESDMADEDDEMDDLVNELAALEVDPLKRCVAVQLAKFPFSKLSRKRLYRRTCVLRVHKFTFLFNSLSINLFLALVFCFNRRN